MTTTAQGYAIAQAFELGISTFWYHEGYRYELNGIDETLMITDGMPESNPTCYGVLSVRCESGKLTITADGFYIVLALDSKEVPKPFPDPKCHCACGAVAWYYGGGYWKCPECGEVFIEGSEVEAEE